MKKLRRAGKEELRPVDWIQNELKREALDLQREVDSQIARQTSLRWQNILLVIITIEFGLVLLFAGVVLLLEGFHLAGFDLSDELLDGLAISTIGAVAGLLTIMIKSLFGDRKN